MYVTFVLTQFSSKICWLPTWFWKGFPTLRGWVGNDHFISVGLLVDTSWGPVFWMQVDASQMEEIYKTIKEGKDGKVRNSGEILGFLEKKGRQLWLHWSSLETERATVDGFVQHANAIHNCSQKIALSLPKTNSLPLKLGHVQKEKDRLQSFQGRTCC